jgi:thiol-disulfide isomerase/thioredoxin
MRSEPWLPAMHRRLQAGVFLAVAALAGVSGFFFSRASLVSPAAERATQTLMLGSLPDLSGKPQTFSQWRGKVLVVNFWATWCAPCREEIPELVKIEKKYVSNGVQIVGIALDNAVKVREYAEEMHIQYALLIGLAETIGLAKDLGNSAGVLPFTIVLDRTGKLVHAHAGAVTETSLSAVLAPLL